MAIWPFALNLEGFLNETNSSDYGTYLMFDTKEGEAGEEDLRRVEDHVEQMRSSDYFLMKVQTI